MATVFDPFWFFKFPFAGDVKQRINSPWFSPELTFNFAGDATIEDRVVAEVASYGRQIGWLNDIALALVEKRKPDPDVVAQLAEAVKAIEKIKAEQKSDALHAAVAALDQLMKSAPDLYEQLLRDRNRGTVLQVPVFTEIPQ
ncbi:hypothetical protein [Duganella hordei]|uniref:hypothetical protein n=1 Tax=Duganella hordei TaxID=2865934 RepID=UPI0030E95185